MKHPFPFCHPHVEELTQKGGDIPEHRFGEPMEDRACEGKATARHEPAAAGLFGFLQRPTATK